MKLFFMGIKGLKTGEKIHIKQAEAVGDKQYKELEPITNVTGIVHKVESRIRKSKEYGDKEEIVIWLKDVVAGEMYCLSTGLTSVGRSIINTLAGIEGNLGELSISVYNNKKTGRPSVYIVHNGVKAGWKFTPDELKKYIIEKKVRKKVDGVVTDVVERDYIDLDAMLMKVWNEEVTKKVQNFSQAEHPEPAKSNADQQPFDHPEPAEDMSSDDLPF